MAADLRQSYADHNVLEADGCRLVTLLYRSALDALTQAQQCIDSGAIRERSAHITRVQEILNELAFAVDHDAGGDVGRNLVELYAYIQTLLIKANTEQTKEPLIEATSLLRPILEAWEQCHSATVGTGPLPDAMVLSPAADRAPLNVTG